MISTLIKTSAVAGLLGATTWVVAAEMNLSELYKEFTKRDQVVFTIEQAAALNFLRLIEFDINTITEMEAYGGIDGTFVLKTDKGEVCLGDLARDSFRCKTVFGVTSFKYLGGGDGD